MIDPPRTVDAMADAFDAAGYVADRALATSTFLALDLGRPLFLEGEAGVGKTEVAKTLARAFGRDLIRLQCYEGLDIAAAAYEWNAARQMLEIRLADAAGVDRAQLADDLYSDRFLIRRPLLDSLTPRDSGPPVLLIDELDRADEPFEAFLLELLSDFQITIPERGTIKAAAPPIVVITSNRTREVHDAVRRRCLYHWVDYPDAERELAILRAKAPDAPAALAQQMVAFVQALRDADLYKAPGVAETIDWAQALAQLDKIALSPELVNDTLGVLLKYQDDIAKIEGSEAAAILRTIQAAAG